MFTHILYLFPKYAHFSNSLVDHIDLQAPQEDDPWPKFGPQVEALSEIVGYDVMSLSAMFGQRAVIPFAETNLQLIGFNRLRADIMHNTFSVRMKPNFEERPHHFNTVVWLNL